MVSPHDRLLPCVAEMFLGLCHVQGQVVQTERKLGPDTLAVGIKALSKLEANSKIGDLDQQVHIYSAPGGDQRPVDCTHV